MQEVVNMLNGIILAINADNSSGRFASIIGKAKEDVTKMIGDIASLKQRHEKAAREQIRSVHQEFDEAARQLIQRFEGETKEQEVRWKEEYENERERLSAGYEQRLKTALGASEQLYEQRLRNELLEQSTALTRSFTDRVQETIEKERNGRLSKLSELQSSMEQVQQLTAGSTELVETTLNTQRLHVALDAVTAKLAAAQGPVPFGPELAALKDAAGPSSALVAAALASIAPLAYNRGLPTAGQLRVRFTDVASEVRKAALLPENAGIASHAVSRVLGVFLLRKDGAPVGDDVESVLARATHQLDQGDLEGAARELNTLTGWAKLLAGDWLRDVRGVCEVQQALDVSSFSVLVLFCCLLCRDYEACY